MQAIPPETFYGPKQATQPHTPPRTEPTNLPEAAKESPVRHSASGYNVFTSMHYLKSTRHHQMVMECRGKFAGPMPPANFLKEFLSDNVMRDHTSRDFRVTESSREHFKEAANCRKEVHMYSHLINGISEYCPNMKVVDTHNDGQESPWARSGTVIKPDITTYDGDAVISRPLDLEKSEVIVEVKLSHLDDPFLDDPPKPDEKRQRGGQNPSPYENPSDDGSETRGQIATYAQAQLAAQYRTHVFSVLIVKGGARLVRWDRAGAVFTRKFDYCNTPYLAEFFWRYNNATSAARGLDMTVERLPLYDQLAVKARVALRLVETAPIYQFEVVDEETQETLYYLGGRPSFAGNKSVTGRATRGTLVYDIKNERVAYMKDTWRVYGAGYEIEKEGRTYKKLKAAGVRHIPTVVAYGDIGDEQWHCTQTQRFARRTKEPLGRLRGHRHSRLVLKEVGRDLSSFEYTGEIVSAVADAVEAHQDAYEKAQVLHRDISAGNILITDDGRGLLIDWDLSKPLSQMGVPRQVERTGTWQFMAARLLRRPVPSTHVLADDLESFYHVLVWITLRFTELAMNDADALTYFIERNFDESWHASNAQTTNGGESKRSYLLQKDVLEFEIMDDKLESLIDDLATVLQVRYEKPPTPEQIQQYNEELERQTKLLAMVPEEGKGMLLDSFKVYRESNSVFQYNTRMKYLESSNWIRERFREAADSRHLMTAGHKINSINDNRERVTRRKNPSEMHDGSRPQQQRKYGHKSPDGDKEAQFAPGAPTIVGGKAIFSPQSTAPEQKAEQVLAEPALVEIVAEDNGTDANYLAYDDGYITDEGYESIWEFEVDEEELDRLVAEQGSTEDDDEDTIPPVPTMTRENQGDLRQLS
ncbi:hypothetical protein VNI00_012412 [Paramarasmius palmivorus]|uniref:Protein kinase domain-containing protein n=1 Tax=Paramarasmius palmivorus TaxID=297713 RepID=A0AAW0C6V1_9AGAR